MVDNFFPMSEIHLSLGDLLMAAKQRAHAIVLRSQCLQELGTQHNPQTHELKEDINPAADTEL